MLFLCCFLGLAFESSSDLCFPGNLELETLRTFVFPHWRELPQGSYGEQN